MSPELPLDDKVVRIDQRLRRARVRHAFGGALALAYYAEPRATVDVDLNVFVPPERAGRVLDALGELGVEEGAGARRRAQLDGQVRVRWGSNPIDLFFAYDPFHDAAARRVREVPFGETSIPILAPEDLLVCKAVFDRRKDWLDIEQVLFTTSGELDVEEVRRWVVRIVGEDDPRYEKLQSAIEGILGS